MDTILNNHLQGLYIFKNHLESLEYNKAKSHIKKRVFGNPLGLKIQ